MLVSSDKYNLSFYSIEEIENKLIDILKPAELNQISSAYDICNQICNAYALSDGCSLFHHCTRVVKILIEELEIYDTSIVCAILLHNASRLSNDLDTQIIDYNFGPYVAYLVDSMTEDFFFLNDLPSHIKKISNENSDFQIADYLILMCSEQLDLIRCIDYDITGEHFNFLTDIAKNIFPLIEKSENASLQYLYKALVTERNKILS
ncbi:MAG: hypothetical protein B7C24_17090 [Bacteroidetes bacterium 4572_77]|nr:MAG: hypothetical protein B7C24_17090 [Bacteroidetes bacterium 4572_77]